MPEILTAEAIWKRAQSARTPLGERRIINRLFRLQDDSHLWPVNGRFNVTERAVRRARAFERQADCMSPLEYAYFIETECSRIVNDPRL